MKKYILFFVTAMLTMAFSVPVFGAAANPASAKVLVNEEEMEFDAYEIHGYTYFKLRDIDWALDDTAAGFELLYRNTDKAVLMYKNPFIYGSEPVKSSGDKTVKNAVYSTQKVFLDDVQVNVAAYNIDGYHYFKLRDLGTVLGFDVEWNSKEKIISITSEYLYKEDNREYSEWKEAAEEAKEKWEKETEDLDEEEAYAYLLLNVEREKRGLKTLKLNEEATEAAEIRAAELKDRYSYTRPNGKIWHTVLKETDVSCDSAAEIMAYGYPTVRSVVEAWMDYEPYRKSIVNKDFEEFGIGYDEDRSTWSVIFIED